ncbi:non-specific lipid transfer protein GPI-anchored 20-like [Henckelia pumila]|uniref:non-specific lipid transfer protein GPI-anchored 20-like n=1 Tax=Henckelia pumila TaxID=405737 RepID=UPI003C6DEF22
MALFSPTFGQMTTSSCTSSMITTFTPCVNFVANGTLNTTTTPPSACCTSLTSLMGSRKECFCQIVTGNAPFQIPINQTLAVSLPRACNMPGVPLQCKALGAPVPAPGPTLAPDVAPSSSTLAPAGVEPQSPILAPEPETTTTATPPSPATTSGVSPAGNIALKNY